ncbi:HepT-like ribonuclease domain-containing protein [Sinomicrobium sp.]
MGIRKIEELVDLLNTYDNFEKKWVEQYAIIRNFEIIGEASSHISDDLKSQYPEIFWNEMKGMRDFMIHEYFGLQLDTIWDTAVNDIPVLKQQIQSIVHCTRFKKELAYLFS